MRPDGRQTDELRPVTIDTNVNKYAEGSALIAMGDTRDATGTFPADRN